MQSGKFHSHLVVSQYLRIHPSPKSIYLQVCIEVNILILPTHISFGHLAYQQIVYVLKSPAAVKRKAFFFPQLHYKKNKLLPNPTSPTAHNTFLEEKQEITAKYLHI